MLSADGLLTRFDREGKVSGRYPTSLQNLFALDAHICGSDESGATYCLLDRHEDLGCTDAAPPLLLPLEGAEQGALAVVQVRQVQVSCEQHCLSFPACAALRCLDPCPDGAAPQMRLVSR